MIQEAQNVTEARTLCRRAQVSLNPSFIPCEVTSQRERDKSCQKWATNWPSHRATKNANIDEEKDVLRVENTLNEEVQKPLFGFYRDIFEEPENNDKEDSEGKTVNDKNQTNDNDSNSQACVSTTSNTKEINMDKKGLNFDDNLRFEEPKATPSKGILVYHHGKEKQQKRIKFKNDSEVANICYFESDNDERVNGNDFKCKNIRQMELNMEKAALKSNDNLDPDKNGHQKWGPLIRIDLDNNKSFVPGHGSKKKYTQSSHAKPLLGPFPHNKETTLDNPSEPKTKSLGMLAASALKPILSPLEGQSYYSDNERDFSKGNWPESQTNQVDRQANFRTDSNPTPAQIPSVKTF